VGVGDLQGLLLASSACTGVCGQTATNCPDLPWTSPPPMGAAACCRHCMVFLHPPVRARSSVDGSVRCCTPPHFPVRSLGAWKHCLGVRAPCILLPASNGVYILGCQTENCLFALCRTIEYCVGIVHTPVARRTSEGCDIFSVRRAPEPIRPSAPCIPGVVVRSTWLRARSSSACDRRGGAR